MFAIASIQQAMRSALTLALRQEVRFYKTRKNATLVKQMKKWHTENKFLYGSVLKEKKKGKKKSKNKKKLPKQEPSVVSVEENLQTNNKVQKSLPDDDNEMFWASSMPSTMRDLSDSDSIVNESQGFSPRLGYPSEDENSTSFTANDFAFTSATQPGTYQPHSSVNFNDFVRAPSIKSPTETNNRYVITDDDLKAPENENSNSTCIRISSKRQGTQKPNLAPLLEFPLVLPNKTIIKSAWPHISNFGNYFKTSDRFPSVSRVLEVTKPPESVMILERWKKMMIAQLGEDGFKEYQKETFRKGHQLHSHIHGLLDGRLSVSDVSLIIEPEIEGHWKSVENVFENVGDVKLLETPIRHPYLRYAGIVDCVARYRDQLCVIEWKTSKKPKRTLQDTFDNPLQVAAYMGAVNSNNEPGVDVMVDHGLVVIAYENGDPADVHYMSKEQCMASWDGWLNRVHKYWKAELKVTDG